MKKEILITLLCASLMLITPFTTIAQENKVSSNLTDESDVEPKDYLFQTIIDIANNPDVKNLLEQYEYDLLKVDIDSSIYRKIIFRNPRLFHSLLFTKPSMSIDYLNKCYNNGIEITKILGENIVIETIESVEVIDMKFFDTLDNIISKDEKLSYRLSTIEIMNNDLKLDSPLKFHPILCAIMILIMIPLIILLIPLGTLGSLLYDFPILQNLLEKFPKLVDMLFYFLIIYLVLSALCYCLTMEVCFGY